MRDMRVRSEQCCKKGTGPDETPKRRRERKGRSFSQKTTVVPGSCEIIRSANLSKTSPTGFKAEPKGTSKTTRKTNKNIQFLVLSPQGIEPGPLYWECRFLATGPSRKSPTGYFFVCRLGKQGKLFWDQNCLAVFIS